MQEIDHSPSRIFCVTVNVFPVSKGTVQLTGSGDRISNCSGDLTRVGSGGDLISGSSIASVIVVWWPSASDPSSKEREREDSTLIIFMIFTTLCHMKRTWSNVTLSKNLKITRTVTIRINRKSILLLLVSETERHHKWFLIVCLKA